MISTECPVCQTAFRSYASQHRIYCSRACKEKAQSASLKGRPVSPQARRPRRGQMVACPICGKEVYRMASQLDVRFCSYACANVWQRRNRVALTCRVCGKEFRRSPSVAAHQTHCSMRCRANDVARPTGRMHNGRPARLDNYGYVLIWEPEHPNKALKGWQYEHRVVAEKMLGRYLSSDEDVHHKREPKSNNDPSNLEVLDSLEHMALSSRNHQRNVRDAFAELAALRIELTAYRARFGPLDKE